MAYNESQKKATMKYMKNNLDDIKTRVPKGMREEYKTRARSIGYESFNNFVVQAIEEKLKREEENHERNLQEL